MNRQLQILLVGAAAALAFFVWSGYQRDIRKSAYEAQIASLPQEDLRAFKIMMSGYGPDSAGFAGSYLVSQFAQREKQWNDAAEYLDRLSDFHPNEPEVLKKSLVLKMGANDPKGAIANAQHLLDLKVEDDDVKTLASVFVITGAFKDGDYARAQTLAENMPEGGLTLFLRPLIDGWIEVANNAFNSAELRSHSVLILQSIYMAEYLDKTKEAVALLDQLSRQVELSILDTERMADLYKYLGEDEKARALYEHLHSLAPQIERFAAKASGNHEGLSLYTPFDSPAQGLARAYYDMAFILYQDQSDDSALVFANMALYLDANLHEARLLLAAISGRHQDYEAAIAYYNAIPENSVYSKDAPLEVANLYEDAGQPDRAISILKAHYDRYSSVQALIRMGDIQRRQDDFAGALASYNMAFEHIAGTDSSYAWHLHYARGMAREQLGQWEGAYQDLNEALSLQPNHPYILNYLGYAMVDRGLNLERAMGMIEKAMALQPRDGAITDSLGWAHYKMGQYEQAVKYLEGAIELLPSDPVINDHLGDAYWKTGRKLEARYQWKRALEHGQDDTPLMTSVQDKIDHGLKPNATAQAIQAAANRTE